MATQTKVGRWEWEEGEGTRNRKHRGEARCDPNLCSAGSGWSPWAGGLEVLVMVGEMSPVLPVNELTGFFHILGHARGATAKHPNLPDLLGKEEVKASSVFGGRASSGSMLKP